MGDGEMRWLVLGSLLAVVALGACTSDLILGVDAPAAPRALAVSYYGGVVTVSWELASDWNGESFRVYSRRVTDADYFMIAEVTNCAGGLCSYEDTNVAEDETYQYYVSAVDPDTGVETASDATVEVFVPRSVALAAPNAFRAIALDNAVYLTWGTAARTSDFSHYKVYQDAADGSTFVLGETDSEGFLDLLATNGESYDYFVTAVDTNGFEGSESTVVEATPRPDFHGEWIYDYFSRSDRSGFRFATDENTDPVTLGDSFTRHFRLEVDDAGWWLVAGAGTTVYPAGFETTALKCGAGADGSCVDISVAPTSGYSGQDLALTAQNSYVLRVVGDDGRMHYGVIRVEMLGFDQDDDALMIFDWAYQLQADNPNLAVVAGN
jgi:hypothetical protein